MQTGWRGLHATSRGDWARTAGISLVFWSAIELWTLVVQATRGSPIPWRYAPGHVVGVIIASLLGVVGFAVLRALSGRSVAARSVAAVAALLVLAPLFALAMPIIHAFTPMLRTDDGFGPQQYLAESLYWLTPFAMWLLLVLVLESARKARVREANLSAAIVAAKEAEIRALHYQVNPHFLYNALNAIATLILDGRNAQAEQMVLRLSDFFRASLVRDPLAEVKLADEVAQQRLYLGLEELRFPDCLRVAVDIPSELAAAEVPSLILQPLVENAVKHGVHAPGRETRIEISARAEAETLVVQVVDNGPGGGGAAGTGVGIGNVRRRLQARFGTAARLEAGPDPDRGYVATLSMPLRFAGA